MSPLMRSLVGTLVLLALALPATATSVRPVPLKCPVCGTTTSGTSVMSTNNFGGIDRDFCRHAFGSQPLLLVVATCPKCHYSAYTDDFEKKPSAEVVKAVQGGALVVASHDARTQAPDVEGVPASSPLPAWVRHDLVRQVLLLRKAEPFNVAWQTLVTSWAVRLGAHIDTGKDAEDEKTFDALVKRSGVKGDDRSGDSVKLGRWLLATLPQMTPQEARVAAPAAIRLLRERGENTLLLASTKALALGFAAERWPAIEKALRESAALEQKYQRLAVEAFTLYLASAQSSKDDHRAHVIYLVGELHRRLGENAKALEYYNQAEKSANLPPEMKEWLTEQKALVTRP